MEPLPAARRRLAVGAFVLVAVASGCAQEDARPTRRIDEVLGLRLRTTLIATVDEPVALVARAGSHNLYVAEKTGKVRVLRPRPGGHFDLDPKPLVDERTLVVATEEQGLLGIAFSPDGGRLVTSRTDPADHFNSVLTMYTMSGDTVDIASKVDLLRVGQPFVNHNGGCVAWGPDGYLYWALGDGGNVDRDPIGDPFDLAQNRDQLLGKILRIDPLHPSAGRPYSIPAGNPFASGGGRPEIWSIGFRNPWRFSFDDVTGDLWVGDVGGSLREEVDLLTKASGGGRGANLGWSLREGSLQTTKPGDRPAELVDPVFEYGHADGGAVMGGGVYRGSRIPGLRGVYVYSDYAAGGLRVLVVEHGHVVGHATLRVAGEQLSAISGFGEGPDREMYALSLTGDVLRIDPA